MGTIESFNGRLRDECLNVHLFFWLEDARQKLEAWHMDYNTNRPHRSLGQMTPTEYVAARENQEAAGSGNLESGVSSVGGKVNAVWQPRAASLTTGNSSSASTQACVTTQSNPGSDSLPADEFVGPFASWVDLQANCGAVGNGVPADTRQTRSRLQ